MVEIETFDGDDGEYSLTPYVRIQDDDRIIAEISLMEQDDEPVLAYQRQNDVAGDDAYRRGMQLIQDFDLGTVHEVAVGTTYASGPDRSHVTVDEEHDHLYDEIRDRLSREPEEAQAVKIEAEHGSYENDWNNGFENITAPYSDDILAFTVDETDLPEDYGLDDLQDDIESTLL